MRRFLSLALLGFITCSVFAQEPKDVLGAIESKRGLVALVGGAGRMAPDLARSSEWTLFVQQEDASAALAIRKELDAAGLLGTRVWVHEGSYARLHLADDLADAVVVGADAKVKPAEALRLVRAKGAVLMGGKVLSKGYRDGTDEWTHPYRAPDNNPQSLDAVARRPFLTHYMVEPWYCPLPMQSVIAGGRIFKVFGDRSSALPQEPLVNKLLAMNAFNGTVLWQRDLSPGFMIHRNTLIATADTLFLGDDQSCKLIDPATGKIRDEIVVPADKSDGPVWKWMALEDGVLYALVGEREEPDQPLKGDRIRGAGWPWWKIKDYRFGTGKNMLAIDPKTKRILWHHREGETIDARGLAMRKGRIYFYCEGKHLGCLDAKTGAVLWRNRDADLLAATGITKEAQHPILGFASTAYMKCSDDAVYFAGPNRPYLAAASTRDGKLLWKRDCAGDVKETKYPKEGGNVHLLIRPDGLYALGQGRINEDESSMKLDPLTGKVLATFPSRDRCTRATGCIDSIFTRGGKGGSTAVFDVTSGEPKMGTLSPFRPACQDGVVTSHGYLFWGPWMCRCDMTQLGVISLGPGEKHDYTGDAVESERLWTNKGAAEVAPWATREDDWPVYRRDNQRTVVTMHTTPGNVKAEWTHTPRSKLIPTAPIVVANRVFLSGSDGAIRAIDATTGAVTWTTYTGGPIKYPPAFSDGRLFIGSGDGHIYCLTAATGELLWKFRAAPLERHIPVYGTLTSTWPVGTGVVVENGVVCGAAGISNYDGTHIFGLNARTGRIRWQQHNSSYKDSPLPMGGISVQGPFLVHDGAAHMAAGNAPTIASFDLQDGRFAAGDNGRGKDLFVRHGRVFGTGFPLYWRPDDDHFLSTMELENPAGVLLVGINPANPSTTTKLALYPRNQPGEQPKELWANHELFQEIAAVAFTKNAVVLTGLNRNPRNFHDTQASLIALRLTDGAPLWKTPLPGVPSAWGLALDRDGRMIVTLVDGRVLAYK
jgi:outer membrane protein assembly factor BamB